MEATPQAYREDITRTKQAITDRDGRRAQLLAAQEGSARGSLVREAIILCAEERAALVRQLAALERGLQRASREWTQAQQQGAGRRLDP